MFWNELASEDGIPLGVMDSKGWEGRGREGKRREAKGGVGTKGRGGEGRRGQGGKRRGREGGDGRCIQAIVTIQSCKIW